MTTWKYAESMHIHSKKKAKSRLVIISLRELRKSRDESARILEAPKTGSLFKFIISWHVAWLSSCHMSKWAITRSAKIIHLFWNRASTTRAIVPPRVFSFTDVLAAGVLLATMAGLSWLTVTTGSRRTRAEWKTVSSNSAEWCLCSAAYVDARVSYFTAL